jgi:hypothetical protein
MARGEYTAFIGRYARNFVFTAALASNVRFLADLCAIVARRNVRTNRRKPKNETHRRDAEEKRPQRKPRLIRLPVQEVQMALKEAAKKD